MILFVDDERRIMDSYLQYLRMTLSPEGYEVEFLSDVNEGVDFFDKNRESIDLVILDIMMPPGRFGSERTNGGLKTGMAFYEHIRERTSDLPIIIFTNFLENEVDERFKRDSKCKFLQKVNYDLKDFLLVVKKVLSLPTSEV